MKDIVLLDRNIFYWYDPKRYKYNIHGWHLYVRIQLTKPFLVKGWCFIKRRGGFNIHLFPIHIHIERF